MTQAGNLNPASSSSAAATTALPKNAQAMALLLQSMGVEDAEPRVVHQLLDLAFRTTVDYLESAGLYAEHAGRSVADLQPEDVKMAIQNKVNAEFTGPPPRELMAEVAAEINREPLPIITEKFGVRLPPEKFCLTQPNYSVMTGSTLDVILQAPAATASAINTSTPSSPVGHQPQQQGFPMRGVVSSANAASAVSALGLPSLQQKPPSAAQPSSAMDEDDDYDI